MADRLRAAIYSIPAHRGFADVLAAGMNDRLKGDPFGLARTVLLLPNNRAVRAVTEAFVRRADGGLLLPRMVTVGDIDLGEQLGSALDPIGSGVMLPRAVPSMQRLMALARLVAENRQALGVPVTAGEALRLGGELGTVIDQLLVERRDPDALLDLEVAGDLAGHWQVSLDLYRMLAGPWRAELDQLGMIEAAERRNLLLDHVARRWRDNPPGGPVFAAGISSNAPAIAGLLRTIAFMPRGHVLLNGVDLAMPEDEWAAIGPHRPDPDTGRRPPDHETHPQYHLKLLLSQMGIARNELMRWAGAADSDAPPARSRAISNAFAPPAMTVKWQVLDQRERSLAGISVVVARDSAEEAGVIAIAIRQALAEPTRRVALVTPDRELARRVASQLERWDIVADDSAGRPLSELPQGALLTIMADAVATGFAPVALLSLLKHPLVMAGEGRLEWLENVRRLDVALRGPRPLPGLAAIEAHLVQRTPKRSTAQVLEFWRGVQPLLETCATLAFDQPERLVDGLVAAADALTNGAVWRGSAGRELSRLLGEWRDNAASGPVLEDIVELPAVLTRLLGGTVVRPAFGSHPRIAIYGLLEARLQQADLVICAGLNEGTWPQLPAPDPWLAQRVRRELALPGLERRIGLAAHDLATAMGAPKVLLTRAQRDRSGPTIASRFLLRLQAMAGVGLRDAPDLLAWAQAIDCPAKPEKIGRPAPTPSAEQRRVTVSVTALDRLKSDPFAFYASRIMGLNRLDAVDAGPGPAWRGTMVHEVLEHWVKADGFDLEKLIARADALLAQTAPHPVVRALWAPRLLDGLLTLGGTWCRLNFDTGRSLVDTEVAGEIMIDGITVHGKADRIDRLADGSLVIVDYKTGAPPRKKQVEAGYALQLGALGLIAERGGFGEITGKVSDFEYWSTARSKTIDRFGYVTPPFQTNGNVNADNFVNFCASQIASALGRWITGAEPFTARLHPEYANYGDYDHLMRLDEWYGRLDEQAEQ